MKIQVKSRICFDQFRIVAVFIIFSFAAIVSGQQFNKDINTRVVFLGYTENNQSNSGESSFRLEKINSVKDYERKFGKKSHKTYLLYSSIRLFYENGGKEAYVLSIGKIDYQNPVFKKSDFINGLKKLSKFDYPTLLVAPETVRLKSFEAGSVHSEMMKKAAELGNCFAILDLVDGDQPVNSTSKPIFNFKRFSGSVNLDYAAAYYPWVVLSGHSESGFNMSNTTDENAIPPGAGVAGAMVSADTKSGIWKAPANIALKGILKPSVNLSETEISELNIDASTGKSINPIVDFKNKGILIWGARTLKGNDNEWKYISIRRLASQLEFEIKNELIKIKNQPNDKTTWTNIINLVEANLNQKWKAGALAGSKPEQAFYVRCGLGSTMTQQDIEDQKLIIEFGFSPARPAEFIVIRLTQQMSD